MLRKLKRKCCQRIDDTDDEDTQDALLPDWPTVTVHVEECTDPDPKLEDAAHRAAVCNDMRVLEYDEKVELCLRPGNRAHAYFSDGAIGFYEFLVLDHQRGCPSTTGTCNVMFTDDSSTIAMKLDDWQIAVPRVVSRSTSPATSSSSTRRGPTEDRESALAADMAEFMMRKGEKYRSLAERDVISLLLNPNQDVISELIRAATKQLCTANANGVLAADRQLNAVAAIVPVKRRRFEHGHMASDHERCAMCNLPRNCHYLRLPAHDPHEDAWYAIGRTCLSRLQLASEMHDLAREIRQFYDSEEVTNTTPERVKAAALDFVKQFIVLEGSMPQACGVGSNARLLYSAHTGEYHD